MTPSKLKQGAESLPVTIKRPGSDKAKKNEKLFIHETKILKLKDIPEGAIFKGYRNFTVQDIVIKPNNILFKCERYLTPDGKTIQACLPPGYEREHFGPMLRTYILHQYHHQGVTQPLLLKGLREWNITISKGQLNRLINDKNNHFHAQKEEILETGIFLSSYLQTDDTGARHKRRNGYCTYIGNDLFAYFKSTHSKSRLNFIECLQGKNTGFCVDPRMVAYLKGLARGAPLKLVWILESLIHHIRFFKEKESLILFLESVGIKSPVDIRYSVEAAAFSYMRQIALSKNIILISDEAGQFSLPEIKHALCWVHIERKLKKLMPNSPHHARQVKTKTAAFWKLYQDLSAYKKIQTQHNEWR